MIGSSVGFEIAPENVQGTNAQIYKEGVVIDKMNTGQIVQAGNMPLVIQSDFYMIQCGDKVFLAHPGAIKKIFPANAGLKKLL